MDVAGGIVGFFRQASNRVGFDFAAFLEGTGLKPEGPDPSRLPWDTFCTLCERLEVAVGGPEALEALGVAVLEVNELGVVFRVLQLVASPQALYWASIKWSGPSAFPGLQDTYEVLPDNKLRITIVIPMDRRDSQQFLRLNGGVYAALPKLLGLPPSRVEAEIHPRKAVYVIEPPPSLTLWSRLRHALQALFSARSAIEVLGAQQASLQAQYEKLAAAHADAQRARDEALQARDAAEAALKVKSEFLGTLSHELLTPMNGILGNADLLEDAPMDESQKESLEILRASAQSMHKMLTGMLDFTQLERRLVALESALFDPEQALVEAARGHAMEAHRKGLTLVCETSQDVPHALQGDARRLRQVLEILLDNAVKFTEHGSVHARLGVRPADQGELFLTGEVQDTGIGMSAEVQTSLYQPFRQGDGSRTRRYGGAGMGLALCRQLVLLMGGELTQQSRAGAGSTFSFTVRVGRGDAAAPERGLDGVQVLVLSASALRETALVAVFARAGAAAEAVSAGDLLARAAELTPGARVAVLDAEGSDAHALAQGLKHQGVPAVLLLPPGPTDTDRLRELSGAWGALPATARDLAQLVEGARRVSPRGPSVSSRAPALLGSIAPAPAVKVSAPPAEPKALSAPPVAVVSLPPARLRVLLAEDNPAQRKLAARLLEKLGAEVEAVDDGEKAVALAARGGFTALLLDCQMPRVDGLEALAKIRALGGAAGRAPAVLLVASDDEEARARAARADDCLRKPLNPAALEAALARCMAPPAGALREVV
ncbi:MAG: response regulator [Deltaproteobacteria bacterium]|nr:response regulator [Deltaproteobacteria bacterium]